MGLVSLAAGAVHAQTVSPAPAPNAAAPAVRAVYEAALRDLPFTDQQDFADARRGFIATLPAGQDTRRYGFLNDEKVPDTVHPSLWRLARLNAINGLFEVVPGVYQVRGLRARERHVHRGREGRDHRRPARLGRRGAGVARPVLRASAEAAGRRP